MAKISVNIVTWNSMRHLPELLESLREQSFSDFEILVIDNASSDGTVEFVRNQRPDVKVLRNFNNLGFAGAHNQGIKYAFAAWRDLSKEDCFVLVTNPDIILEPDFLEKIASRAEANTEAGSFGGKLLKAVRKDEDGFHNTVKTGILDSVGLAADRGRRVYDRGAGEPDRGQFDGSREVFGISGALALYRASALDAVRCGEEYFDETFFAYKEDVDLAWRLQLAGFKAEYVPNAIAYHFRKAGGRERSGWMETLMNRRKKPEYVNFYSYRNHLWMLVKNEQWGNLARHLPWVSAYEAAKFAEILFFEPRLLRASVAFWKELPKMLEKRRVIMAKSRVPAGGMRKWFK